MLSLSHPKLEFVVDAEGSLPVSIGPQSLSLLFLSGSIGYFLIDVLRPLSRYVSGETNGVVVVVVESPFEKMMGADSFCPKRRFFLEKKHYLICFKANY